MSKITQIIMVCLHTDTWQWGPRGGTEWRGSALVCFRAWAGTRSSVSFGWAPGASVPREQEPLKSCGMTWCFKNRAGQGLLRGALRSLGPSGRIGWYESHCRKRACRRWVLPFFFDPFHLLPVPPSCMSCLVSSHEDFRWDGGWWWVPDNQQNGDNACLPRCSVALPPGFFSPTQPHPFSGSPPKPPRSGAGFIHAAHPQAKRPLICSINTSNRYREASELWSATWTPQPADGIPIAGSLTHHAHTHNPTLPPRAARLQKSGPVWTGVAQEPASRSRRSTQNGRTQPVRCMGSAVRGCWP